MVWKLLIVGARKWKYFKQMLNASGRKDKTNYSMAIYVNNNFGFQLDDRHRSHDATSVHQFVHLICASYSFFVRFFVFRV